MNILKIVVKILLFPLILLCYLLSFVITFGGQFVILALKFIAGIFALGVLVGFIYSVMFHEPLDVTLIISCAVVAGAFGGLSYLIEVSPYALSNLASKLLEW